jgi:hypothetical protein
MDSSAELPPQVRVDLLRQLAELAMSDEVFRASALEDLDGTLARYGYQLNADELALVHHFRATLADAGVDLDIVRRYSEQQLKRLLG